MHGKLARRLLIAISVILAILLLTRTISVILGCVIFAISLAILGIFSKGYGKKSP